MRSRTLSWGSEEREKSVHANISAHHRKSQREVIVVRPEWGSSQVEERKVGRWVGFQKTFSSLCIFFPLVSWHAMQSHSIVPVSSRGSHSIIDWSNAKGGSRSAVFFPTAKLQRLFLHTYNTECEWENRHALQGDRWRERASFGSGNKNCVCPCGTNSTRRLSVRWGPFLLSVSLLSHTRSLFLSCRVFGDPEHTILCMCTHMCVVWLWLCVCCWFPVETTSEAIHLLADHR